MDNIYDIKEQIRAANDITDIISEYTTINSNNMGICPLHDDKAPSLRVYPNDQSWYCFGCGKGGDVFNFIADKENLDIRSDFPRILRILADKADISMPNIRVSRRLL